MSNLDSYPTGQVGNTDVVIGSGKAGGLIMLMDILATSTRTLTGNIILTVNSLPVNYLDPGGSNRDVTLPAEADARGLRFWFSNRADAAESLLIKNDGGSTVVTIGQNQEGFVICDGTNWVGFKGHTNYDAFELLAGTTFEVRTATLTGADTLTVSSKQFQVLDPGGASRDVTLPAEASSTGFAFWIVNTADAAENLVVKDDAAATIITIGQNQRGFVLCNGTSWFGFIAPTTSGVFTLSAGTTVEVRTATLTGNDTLTAASKQIQHLDPGGAGRDVTLPAEASSTGLIFYIKNTADAAETLTVKDDAAATVLTIDQSECGMVWCDGVSWGFSIGKAT